MPVRARLAFFPFLFMLCGCRPSLAPEASRAEAPLPPNTILLSQMMRELSARPGFTEALLEQIRGAGQAQATDAAGQGSHIASKRGPTLLTPTLVDELRKRILGRDWQGLDRFPGWTMRAINPTVDAAGHLVPNTPASPAAKANATRLTPAFVAQFLDLGPYTLSFEKDAAPQTISLDQPSTLPGFAPEIASLGGGVTRGDGPNPQLAPQHAESQRLADVLNRLAANQLAGAAPFRVTVGRIPIHERGGELGGSLTVSTPQDLLDALTLTGHRITVTDSRYFANFGHLHYSREGAPAGTPPLDVMMPFWMSTQLAIPGTGGLLGRHARPLLVPVSHAELEWHIRPPEGAPGLHADVSWYFGIDGHAQWRTMDTQDQAWVQHRDAHTWTGTQAAEATRLAGLFTAAYVRLHAANPTLPFGGYYALGVCQDAVAAVERHLTGFVTLFPNTADLQYFAMPANAEVNALFADIPRDRHGRPPDPERIFGSLPLEPDPTTPDAPFHAVSIPGLAPDLNAAYLAWRDDSLHRMPRTWLRAAVLAGAAGIALAAFVATRRRRGHAGR